MTLEKFLLDSKVNQIENDAEFCEAEHDLIAEYIQNYEVSEEDRKLAETKGYDISFFE